MERLSKTDYVAGRTQSLSSLGIKLGQLDWMYQRIAGGGFMVINVTPLLRHNLLCHQCHGGALDARASCGGRRAFMAQRPDHCATARGFPA